MNFMPVMIMTADNQDGLPKHNAHTVAYLEWMFLFFPAST
jgi:hypothetical protein